MRAIAERLIFREATSTELWVLDGAGDIAICINEIHCASNTDRPTLGIDKGLSVIAHLFTVGLIEIVAKCLRTRWVAQLRHCL